MLLGTLRLHQSENPGALLQRAADLGLGVDTADVYGAIAHGTEAMLGDFRGERITKGGLVRKGKNWRPDGRAKHLLATAAVSAETLGRIDTFLLHTRDPAVPFARSWRALQKIQNQGLATHIGLSNPSHAELSEALDLGGVHTVQIELSVFQLDALRSGIVRLCLASGVRVLAHSPLGGWRRKNRVPRDLHALVRDSGVSGERLCLRWLESLGVEPVVGCTRVKTLEDACGTAPDRAIVALRQAIPQTLLATEQPKASGNKRVVLVMGLPASGKTTRARHYTASGHDRLNRDELGGTLKGLVQRLDERLSEGSEAVVLDNTWFSRALRNRVVEVADRHGASVHCDWMPTDLRQCRIQAVRRILSHRPTLPEPKEMKNGEPWCFGPDALWRIAGRFEAPTSDEGFSLTPLSPPPLPTGSASGTIVGLEVLEKAVSLPSPVFVAAWIPDEGRRGRLAKALGRHEVAALITCAHPPGPAVCWCRKPLPGMGLWLAHHHDLDPDHTTVIGVSGDKAFAAACGFRFQEA